MCVDLCACLWLAGCCVCVLCASGNKLGAEGGAAVAEAIKSCKQLTTLYLQGMYLVLLSMAVCGLGWWYSSVGL